MSEQPKSDRWVKAFSTTELARRRKLKLQTEEGEIVVVWHDGCPRALANVCVHQERELVKGTIFGERIVCPGHQWAFDLETGYCKERDRHQPIHEARVDGGIVYVNINPAST